MPLLFLIAGLILIVTVVRGTTGDFASTLADDVTSGYLKWLAAILAIGLLGYIPALEKPSRYLLGLVALVILLTNGSGFIQMFVQQIENPGTATATTPAGGNANLPAIPVQTGGGGSAGASTGQQPSSNPLGTAASIASTAAKIVPFLGI